MPIQSLKVAIMLASLVALISPVRALDFYFTFDGLVTGGPGSGTVSGEIFGLQDNATSQPTSIVVTSAPFGVLPVTFDSPFIGTFTVNSGMLTDGSMNAQDDPGDSSFYQLILSNSDNTFYYDTPFLDHYNISNNGGFAGVTYTPAAVPEPSNYGLLICTAVGLLVGGRRLLRKREIRSRAMAQANAEKVTGFCT